MAHVNEFYARACRTDANRQFVLVISLCARALFVLVFGLCHPCRLGASYARRSTATIDRGAHTVAQQKVNYLITNSKVALKLNSKLEFPTALGQLPSLAQSGNGLF